MPKWLMVLMAAACLVVCAAGANYVWLGWQARRQVEQDRAAIWELLQAQPGDIETATKTCGTVRRNLTLADGLNWDAETRNGARQIIAICETNGFMPPS